jgi:hypothetical protein
MKKYSDGYVEHEVGEIFRDPDSGTKIEVKSMDIIFNCCEGCYYHTHKGCRGVKSCSNECRSDNRNVKFIDAEKSLKDHIARFRNCK